jgi:Tol biopolymer transport system component
MRRVITVITLASAFLTGQAFAGQWTTPVPVASGINSQYVEATPFLSSDGLSLYFSRQYGLGPAMGPAFSIYEAKRSQPSGDFMPATLVYYYTYTSLMHPWVSPDNLRMYYVAEVGSTQYPVRMARRGSDDQWYESNFVYGLPSGIINETLSQDELTMVYDISNGSNAWDLYIASRTDRNSAFGNIRNLSEINTSFSDNSPSLSPDGLSLYFSSDRNGLRQIFEATRQSLNDPFGNLQHLTAFDSPAGATWPSISSDGTSLYFSYGGSNPDIYVSYLVPEPATILLLGLGAAMINKKAKIKM